MKKLCSIPQQATLLLAALLFSINLSAIANDLQDAGALYKQGKHNEALSKVDQILANQPKDTSARFLKGLILADLTKTPAAIEIFKALTEDHPELPEPYNNLAVLYARSGQYDKATQTLEKALHTDRSYGTAYDNLGEIYAEMARKAYEKALQTGSSSNIKQTELAMIPEIHATVNLVSASALASSPPAKTVPVKTAAATPPIIVAVKSPEIKVLPVENTSAKEDESRLLSETVKAWAAAWSAQDVSKYLAFYAGQFNIPDGSSRSAWEKLRRERIENPKFIHVEVRNISIRITDNEHAEVKFRQSYKASHLKSTNSKTLKMVKDNGKWLILEERSK